MEWTRVGIATIVLNILLLLPLVITVLTVYSGLGQKWSSEEVVVDTLRQQVNQSSSADKSVLYQGDMKMPTRPVLHQGFMIQSTSRDSNIVKMDIASPPEAMTALLQGFQLHVGDVYVPLSGYYLIHMDVTYFFRGHVDGSQVNVYVTCSRSDTIEDLVKITQWCRIGRYCSVTFHGISFLSQDAIVYCEASHANEIITAIDNTHISLVFC